MGKDRSTTQQSKPHASRVTRLASRFSLPASRLYTPCLQASRSGDMSIDFGWFLPTMGDTETIGPPSREATTDYLVQVARTAEDAGFVFVLVPVGTTCEDAWIASAFVAARTE